MGNDRSQVRSSSEDVRPQVSAASARSGTITEADILARDLPRRSFFRNLGVFTGAALFGTVAAGCNGSDECDDDTGDSVEADTDPTDSVRVDADSGDSCDSD